MRRLLFSIVIIAAVLAGIGAPAQTASAQGPVINAELNKSFTPISIVAGQITRLNITIFNTNAFPLEDAAWTDNLIGVQPGMRLADPVNLTNSCGGTVSAEPNGTTIALSGGTVPPQVGATLGSCSVEVDVTSTASGNLVNTIPANVLTAIGSGMDITNTTPASATLRVSVVQPPSLSKAFSPNTVYVGQTSQLTITIRNTDLVNTLTELSVTDPLPPNVALANPVAASLTACGASAALSAFSGSSVITLSNASIAPNTSCLVRVNVVSLTPNTYTNTINPGAISTRQGVTNGSAASAPLNVQAVGIAKAFSPATFQAGGESTLTITLRNPTGAPYTNVSITDTLPAAPNTNLTVVPGSAATTCGGTAITTLPRSVTLTGGTIPAGTPAAPGICTVTVRVTAPAGAPAATYNNTIPANAMSTEQGVTNNLSASANVNVYAQGAGISGAAKSFSPNPISPGENSRLRITIPAPADTALTNFSITDRLPDGMIISNSTAPSRSNCGAASVINAPTGGDTFTLTNATIAAGTTCTINVYVTAAVAGVYQNVIEPDRITNDQNRRPVNNITGSLTVRSLSGMTVAKAFYPTTVNPNGISTLTITLTNTNSSPLTGVSLADPLPFTNATNGIFAAPTPNISTTCGAGSVSVTTAANQSQTVVMTGGSVPAQVSGVAGVCTINIDVIGRGAAATRTNTIPIANVSATISGTGDVIAPQAAASATLTIANISIGVVKGFTPLTIFGGSASTLTVQLNNPTNAQLVGIAFTDNMPAGMIIANPPNLSTGGCGGAISGAPGESSFSFSGGNLPPAGSCSLSLSVTMTVNANLTNIIPANAVTTTNGARNPQATQATLTNLPGASVSKVFSPNPVVAGLENYSLLTITIQNTGNTPITSMALLDRLPAGLQIANTPAAVNNCGGALAADAGGTDILLSGGVLAGNMSCTIVVPVSGANPGNYVNSIPAGALSNLEGATNTLPAEDTLVLTARPELSLVKSSSFDPGADGYANPGEIISYAFLIRNSGNVPLTDVAVTDPLPGLSAITCPQTTLAVGEEMTCTATYAVTQADIDAGSVYNLATADSGESGPGTDENTQPLPQNPALTVEKSSTTTSLSAPGTVTYSYQVTNTGNITLTGIILSDDNDNDDLTCPADTLAVGTSMTCTATHTFTQDELEAGGSLDNIVTADSDETEPVTDDLSIPISQNPAINLEKTGTLHMDTAAPDDEVNPGDTITYAFTVINTGNVTLTDITLSDTVGGVTISGGPLDELAPGESDSATFTGSYTIIQDNIDAGSFTNTATVTGITPGDDTVSDPDEHVQILPGAPSLGAAKRLLSAPVEVSPGVWNVIYEIVVRNYGNLPVDDLQVDEDLAATFPPDTIFVINDLSCTGCLIDTAFDGVVHTGMLAGTETLPVGATFVIQLDLNVTPDASGPFNNTAAASGSTPAGDPVSDDSHNGADPDPDGDGDPTNNNAPTPVDFGPSLFDPPIGFKTFNARRLPVLRWTVVWVNNSNIVAIDAVSSDPIPQGSAFDDDGVPSGYTLPAGPLPAGSTATGVSCVDSSPSTSTTYCYYEGPSTEYPRGRVVWQGTLGPDFGVTDVELALNRINISFSTRVSGNTNRVSNTAVIDADRNGDGDVADAGEARSATASAAWRRRAAQDEELPATGFAPGKITRLPPQPSGLTYTAAGDLKLQIPALTLDTPILAVPLGEEGWRVDWLGHAVGYLEGTAFPTWNGNSVLTAHVYDANGKPGPFINLGSLRWGDRVVVRAFGQNYIYEVRSVRTNVRPDDADVITHEETPWLTLITCQGYDETTGGYRWRTVVRAALVKVE